MLQRESLRGFLPAKRLSQELAEQLLQRADDRMQWGDSLAGWQDLQQAAVLGGSDEAIRRLRSERLERGLEAVRQFLLRNEPQLALDELARLDRRQLVGDESRRWKQVAQSMLQADAQARKGQATEAAESLGRARQLVPTDYGEAAVRVCADQLIDRLARREAEMHDKASELQRLDHQLHRQLTDQAWSEVLATAEAVLELAPEHGAARRAKRKAWQAVGMDVTQVYRPTGLKPQNPVPLRYPGRERIAFSSTRRARSEADVDTKGGHREPGRRFVAWIDAVGGYMICLGDEVVLGQPTASGPPADVPILGDVSRRHAVLRRDGEAYVITPIHSVTVDGVKLAGPTVLRDGALMQLGDSVVLRFRKPHALSASAVLSFESRHKTEPAVDAVVLMAESCILGPQSHCHIPCRKWPGEMVLVQRDGQLMFRTNMPVELDGEPAGKLAAVGEGSRLESDEIALSFEEI